MTPNCCQYVIRIVAISLLRTRVLNCCELPEDREGRIAFTVSAKTITGSIRNITKRPF